MENNKSKDDVFKEAREQSIKAALIKQEIEVIPEDDKQKTLAIIKERLEEGETQWDLLKRMIDGSMTEKFIQILGTMPDRDFVRNYLKLLEHFKPKLVRGEDNSNDREDTTINIQAVIINKQGEKEVIAINEFQNEKISNEGTDL